MDNRPGANGIIAMTGRQGEARRYTLVYASASVLAMNPFIYKSLPYNTLRDFTPITQAGANPMGLVVSPALGVNSLGELIALAKARPGELNFGSFGIGNQTHLMGEMLSSAAGIKITHVPYKGQTPAITDLMGGQVQMAFTTLAGVTDPRGIRQAQADRHLRRGARRRVFPTCRPCAVQLSQRDHRRLERAAGAAAGVPPRVLGRLQGGMAQTLALPEVKAAFSRRGAKAAPSSSDAFSRLIQSEAQKFSVIIKAAGLEGTQWRPLPPLLSSAWAVRRFSARAGAHRETLCTEHRQGECRKKYRLRQSIARSRQTKTGSPFSAISSVCRVFRARRRGSRL